MRTLRVLAVVMTGVITGCPSPDSAAGLGTTKPPDQFLDYNEFVCGAQPVLIKRCSYLACHGDAAHAFRLFSIGKLRLGDMSTRKGRSFDPLTADEIEKNFESASGMVYGAADDERQHARDHLTRIALLYKPVRASAGGGEHAGVGVFPAFPAATLDDDAEFAELVDWVQGKRQPSPVTADCQALFDIIGIAPK
jgi:hypothetical protein